MRRRTAFIADGNSLFNRSGPTVIDTADVLAELLHLQLFAPNGRGTHWEAFS
ncbi:MAG: hypothetical protein ACLQVI_12605 [Polyangiaceae bacterium]